MNDPQKQTKIKIKTADINTEAYKTYKKWVLAEWTEVDQLPDDQLTQGLPLPLLAFTVDSTLCGGLSFIHFKSPEAQADALWINTVYVHENQRGQGIAQLLITAAERVSRENNYEILYVYTTKPDLYKKIGWTVLKSDEKNYILKKIL